MIEAMNNYHVTRCQELVNNPNISSELKMIAEAMVAMGSGIDDADAMAQQALERIDICLERLQAVERRLDAIDARQSTTGR